jgi:hypothetical protein
MCAGFKYCCVLFDEYSPTDAAVRRMEYEGYGLADCGSLSAKVDEMDPGDGLAEEVGAETLEFFDGVGCVEGTVWCFVSGAVSR